jgi:hypothetical protein
MNEGGIVKNMELWEKVHKPPQSALKQIGGGRLRGMTDINPQWRLEAATEIFGPCGIGWKYTIDKQWLEPAQNGEIAAFAIISLSYHLEDTEGWSEPIPGIGGSMFVEEETKGPHVSDEAYKMAVTDALSVAFKALGFGAEVYAGRWDGSKYKEKPASVVSGSETTGGQATAETETKTEPKPASSKSPATGPTEATEKRMNELYSELKAMGKDPRWISDMLEAAKQKYGGILPMEWVERQLTNISLAQKKEP